MSKKFFVIAIILLAAVGAVYFQYVQKEADVKIVDDEEQEVAEEVEDNEETAPNSEEINKDFSMWQTYKNENFGLSITYPKDWDETVNEEVLDNSNILVSIGDIEIEFADFSDIEGGDFTLQSIDNTRIPLTFNAPVYCRYDPDSGLWVPGSGDYAPDPDKCSPEIKSISNVKVFGFSRSALGAEGYSYSAPIKNSLYMLTAEASVGYVPDDYDPDFETEAQNSALQDLQLVIKNNRSLFITEVSN